MSKQLKKLVEYNNLGMYYFFGTYYYFLNILFLNILILQVNRKHGVSVISIF